MFIYYPIDLVGYNAKIEEILTPQKELFKKVVEMEYF